MDKQSLKKAIKPILKECVRELLIEEGLMKIVAEAAQPAKQQAVHRPQVSSGDEAVRKEIQENKKRMLDEIGKKGYLNGVNPFVGIEPISESQAPERQPVVVSERQKLPPAMKEVDPSDPGINITGIMNLAAGRWKAHMGGKG